jgi:uncharacterized protein YpbB
MFKTPTLLGQQILFIEDFVPLDNEIEYIQLLKNTRANTLSRLWENTLYTKIP